MKYVGSRYVPKFMGLYDATQIYEALCVVENGTGTSYISQKIVPAGTPLTNTSYWAVYGASSGAIINLQDQIDAHTSRLDDLEDLEYYVTPQMYGAVGDGITDDTQAIQDAIDSNIPVIIPTGTYKVSTLLIAGGQRKIISYGDLVSSGILFTIRGYGNRIELHGICTCNGNKAIDFDASSGTITNNYLYAKRLVCYGKYGIYMQSTANGIYQNTIIIDELNYKIAGETSPTDITDADATFAFYLSVSSTGFINENYFGKCAAPRWTSVVNLISAGSNPINNNTFDNISPEKSNHGIYLDGVTAGIIGNHFLHFRNEELMDEHCILNGKVGGNEFSFSMPVRAKMFITLTGMAASDPNNIINPTATGSGGSLWGGVTIMRAGYDSKPVLFPSCHNLGFRAKSIGTDLTYDLHADSAANNHQYGVVNVSALSDVNIYLSTSFFTEFINELRVINNTAFNVKIYMPNGIDSGGNLTYQLIATISTIGKFLIQLNANGAYVLDLTSIWT